MCNRQRVLGFFVMSSKTLTLNRELHSWDTAQCCVQAGPATPCHPRSITAPGPVNPSTKVLKSSVVIAQASASVSEPQPDPEADERRVKAASKVEALQEKELGNAAYKKKQFEVAVGHYDRALELYDEDISFLTNRWGSLSLIYLSIYLRIVTNESINALQ